MRFGQSSFNQLYFQYRKAANKRILFFGLTKRAFRKLTSSDCHYCGAKPTRPYRPRQSKNGWYLYNGIDRVDNRLGYIPSNCVPCCILCNKFKSTLTKEEFLQHVERINQYQKTVVIA